MKTYTYGALAAPPPHSRRTAPPALCLAVRRRSRATATPSPIARARPRPPPRPGSRSKAARCGSTAAAPRFSPTCPRTASPATPRALATSPTLSTMSTAARTAAPSLGPAASVPRYCGLCKTKLETSIVLTANCMIVGCLRAPLCGAKVPVCGPVSSASDVRERLQNEREAKANKGKPSRTRVLSQLLLIYDMRSLFLHTGLSQ
jgi:hypothetical protein